MNALRLTFERKVGEHGMLYGSVTSMDIQEALREKGYEFDRRRIHLAEAIKETGEFTVRVRLHREVNVEIPVIVTAEGGAAASSEAAFVTAEATDGGAADAASANDSPEATTDATAGGESDEGDE